LASTIAGADDFVDTTLWGAEHLTFLRRFSRYENGIPSHDTRTMSKSVGCAAFFACVDSTAWILCVMCRRQPSFPR